MIKIKSKTIDLVDPKTLIPWEKNANKHTPEQIARIAQVIEESGFRNPLTVKIGTNIIIAGCGRWEASLKLKMDLVPVSFQEFEDEAEMFAHMVADNALQSKEWGGGIDLSIVNKYLGDYGPGINVDLLGIKEFTIEPLDKYSNEDLGLNKPKEVECPNCNEVFDPKKHKA